MSNYFRKLFIDHPESVDESYLTHAYKATTFGFKLIVYGLAEIIHAILPGMDFFELFGTNSYTKIKEMSEELKIRKLF